MSGPRGKPAVASWHRWLGLILSLPLLGWIISSAAMLFISTGFTNGLQGVFALKPYNSVDVPLTAAVLTPTQILKRLAGPHGIERVHWIRLESRGPHLWYVVRPTPTSLGLTFDARTGERLDPLPEELLRTVADEALEGTTAAGMRPVPEFNRDYAVARVPAMEVTMAGEQPSILLLSRDSGRTLRRMDPAAQNFHRWYQSLHVNQYTDHVIPWTALLYLCAVGVIVVTILGYFLFWWRRVPVTAVPVAAKPAGWFSARNLHRKLGVGVGGVLIVQLLAGIYLWLSLGPLNDTFRGKGSFPTAWAAGIATREELADPATVLDRVAAGLPSSPRPVQAIEWRRLGGKPMWFVTLRRDERPYVFAAGSSTPIEALHPEVAGAVAREEMAGQPTYDYLGPLHFQSMDLNRRLPAYRFRFHDADKTDVYVLQNTGEIVMRRPAFWRMFGPFYATHMLAVTRNKAVDITLLALFQGSFLVVILSGWRLHFSGQRERAAAANATTQQQP